MLGASTSTRESNATPTPSCKLIVLSSRSHLYQPFTQNSLIHTQLTTNLKLPLWRCCWNKITYIDRKTLFYRRETEFPAFDCFQLLRSLWIKINCFAGISINTKAIQPLLSAVRQKQKRYKKSLHKSFFRKRRLNTS